MICMKIHSGNGERILAACDEDVLGKTFRGDGMRITVNEGFYNGDLVKEEFFISHMKDATIMNLVGEKVIALAIKEGHVKESAVMDIGGVKHVQVVNI